MTRKLYFYTLRDPEEGNDLTLEKVLLSAEVIRIKIEKDGGDSSSKVSTTYI